MMGDNESDPSLPLQDETLFEGLNNLAQDDESNGHGTVPFSPPSVRVRFGSEGTMTPPSDDPHEAAPSQNHLAPPEEQLAPVEGLTESSWQVDGSYDSIVSNRSLMDRQGTQGLTMRDYEEQLSSLRKENFNLKLRIYFMEENKGMLHGQVEQENLYRINIDLKVNGEELKKELSEKRNLLAEAARAIQALEEKYKNQIIELQEKLEDEKFERKEAETRRQELELQTKEQVEAKKTNEASGKGLSDVSRFLYNEAFGSFNLGQRVDQTAEGTASDSSQLKNQMAELASELTTKSRTLDELKSEMEVLGADLVQSNIEKDHFCKELSQKEEELQRTRELLEKEKFEKEQKQEEIGILGVQIVQLETKIRNNEVTNEQTNKEKGTEQLVQQVSQLEQQQSELEQKRGNLEHQVKQLEEQQSELEQQRSDLEQHVGQLQHHVSESDLKIKNLDHHVTELEDQRSNHLAQIVELKRQTSELRNELNDTEAQNKLNESNIRQCNETVSKLETELRQRNEQVCSFLTQIKKLRPMKLRPRSSENMINNDVIDLDENDKSIVVDHNRIDVEDLDEAIVESQAILAEIMQNSHFERDQSLSGSTVQNSSDSNVHAYLGSNSSNSFGSHHKISPGSKECSPGTQQHLEYALERNAELETALHQADAEIQRKHSKIEKLEGKLQVLMEERLQEEDKMEKLYSKFEKFEENLQIADSNLKKAHKCIQGFVKENHILSEKLKHNESRSVEPDLTSVEVRRGIAKAVAKFEPVLRQYRGRYDKLRGYLKQRDTVCEMLRVRMEELAHFLAQLIESGDDTLNLSCVSLDLRETIQISIEQSLVLSASILQSNSLIEDERLEEEVDGFNDDWLVPNVSWDSLEISGDQENHVDQNHRRHSEGALVHPKTPDGKLSLPATLQPPGGASSHPGSTSLLCHSATESQDPSLGTEYETLLIDLRDALRKRREAEEVLETKEMELSNMKRKLELAEHEIIGLKSASGGREGARKQSFEFVRPKTPQDYSLPSSPVPALSRIPVRSIIRSPSLPGKLQRGNPSLPERKGVVGTRSSSLPRPHFHTIQGKGSDSISEAVDRKHVSRIPKPVNRNEEEEDVFSEPDKEESRRRMGIICKDKDPQSNRQWFRGGSEEEGSWERSRLDKLRKEKELLAVDLGILKQEKSVLEKKLAKMQGNLDTAELIIKEQQQQMNISKEQQQQQQQQQQLNDKKEKNLSLESLRSSQSRPDIPTLADGSSEEENQNRINELELRTQGQNEALSHLKSKLDKTEKRLSKDSVRYQRRCEELELKFETEKAKVQALEENIVTMELQETRLKKEIDKIIEINRELEGEKKEMGRALAILRDQVSQLEESRLMMQSLETEFNKLSREKKEIETLSIGYLENLKTMEHTVHKLKSSNSRLETKHRNAAEEHQTDLVRLERNLEKLTSDKVDLSNKLSSAAKKLEINEKTQHRLEASRALAESLCTEYRDKRDSITSKLEETLDQLRRSEQSAEHLQLQTSQLKNDLREARTAESEIKSKYAELRTAESVIRSKYAELISSTVSDRDLENKLEKSREDKKLMESKLAQIITEKKEITREKDELATKFKKTEHILRTLTEESSNIYEDIPGLQDKENMEGHSRENHSKHELEMALKQSFSRRTPLASIDLNSDRSFFLSAEKPKIVMGRLEEPREKEKSKQIRFEDLVDKEIPGILFEDLTGSQNLGKGVEGLDEQCCSAQEELVLTRLERDAALSKLHTTRGALKDAAERISKNNRRKKKVEEAIVQQLTKTRTVLKKAQDNLEGCSTE